MNDRLSNFANALPEQAAEEARLAVAPLKPRREALLAALSKIDVKDDEDVRRAVDTIILGKALRDAADLSLQPVVTPHREAVHAVSTVAHAFVDELKTAEWRAQKSIDAFRRRQREAAAAAKSEQEQREAALRRQAGLESSVPEPVKPADVQLGPVRSDYRGQVFDRKTTLITIDDPRALPDTVLKAPGVTAALETAVRQLLKLTKTIPGATIEYDRASTVKAG